MSRVTQPLSKSKSPVVQSAQVGDSIINRLKDQQMGLSPSRPAVFMDLTQFDHDAYIDSLNLVAQVKQRFAGLPSGLRGACLNDPRYLLQMAQNAHNGDDLAIATLKRYGLSVTPPKEPAAEPQKPAAEPQKPAAEPQKPAVKEGSSD